MRIISIIIIISVSPNSPLPCLPAYIGLSTGHWVSHPPACPPASGVHVDMI